MLANQLAERISPRRERMNRWQKDTEQPSRGWLALYPARLRPQWPWGGGIKNLAICENAQIHILLIICANCIV